jgi:hypothetical protein
MYPTAWVMCAERAGGSSAREIYTKKHLTQQRRAEPAGSTVLLSARAMRVCFVLAGAHTPCMKAAAASGLRALSLSEVIVSGAHCTCGLWCLYVAIGLILFKAKIFVYIRAQIRI